MADNRILCFDRILSLWNTGLRVVYGLSLPRQEMQLLGVPKAESHPYHRVGTKHWHFRDPLARP